MNVSTMAAINSINTMNLMMALQLEVNTIFVVNDGNIGVQGVQTR